MKKIIMYILLSTTIFSYNSKKLEDYVLNKTNYKGRNMYNSIMYYSSVYNIPQELVIAVIEVESNFKQYVVSNAGAIGLMQLMPTTAQELKVDPQDEEENIKGGVIFLKECLEKNNGDIGLALASYNAGYGNVKKFDSVPPFDETQEYIQKVISIYNQLSDDKYIFNNINFSKEDINFKTEKSEF